MAAGYRMRLVSNANIPRQGKGQGGCLAVTEPRVPQFPLSGWGELGEGAPGGRSCPPARGQCSSSWPVWSPQSLPEQGEPSCPAGQEPAPSGVGAARGSVPCPHCCGHPRAVPALPPPRAAGQGGSAPSTSLQPCGHARVQGGMCPGLVWGTFFN